MTEPIPSPAVPAGFEPLAMGGEFMRVNGPLYLRHEGDLVQVGFRVVRPLKTPTAEERKTLQLDAILPSDAREKPNRDQ